jgi:hypothetical protein
MTFEQMCFWAQGSGQDPGYSILRVAYETSPKLTLIFVNWEMQFCNLHLGGCQISKLLKFSYLQFIAIYMARILEVK